MIHDLFIQSNSAWKISFNDGSLIIVPAIGLTVFKELAMLVVQLGARQNPSFVSTTFLSLIYFM